MLSRKKLLSAVTTSLCLISFFVVSNAKASLINIAPEDIVHASVDGDLNFSGIADGSVSLNNTQLFMRERNSNAASQEKWRIASFFKFDLSSLTTSIVNSSIFSATFEAELAGRVNTVRNLGASIGQVNTNWDNVSGSFPLFEYAAASTNKQTLVGNVKTAAFTTYSIDITSIVRDWVNGTQDNNGLVLFGSRREFQGAGFNSTALKVEVPEPSSIAILGLGLIGLGLRRFKR